MDPLIYLVVYLLVLVRTPHFFTSHLEISGSWQNISTTVSIGKIMGDANFGTVIAQTNVNCGFKVSQLLKEDVAKYRHSYKET